MADGDKIEVAKHNLRNMIEGRHVMEIFVPQEDNPTGQYLFRKHFRPKGYRSEAGWVTMPIGKLDKTTRATLVEYCSDQDPTHVGNDQNSNCITCVVDSIRAMCISAADHKNRVCHSNLLLRELHVPYSTSLRISSPRLSRRTVALAPTGIPGSSTTSSLKMRSVPSKWRTHTPGRTAEAGVLPLSQSDPVLA